MSKGILENSYGLIKNVFSAFFKKDRNGFFNRQKKLIEKIRKKEQELGAYRDETFAEMFNKILIDVKNNKIKPIDVIDDVFAMVSEVSARTLKKRLYDVQLAGGIALTKCKIAEMKTGEGKTLVACLPAVLFSLQGKSVHVVTPNDYLAKRDAENLQPIYNMLGLTVGYIQEDSSQEQRKEAYSCNIVYGSNNQFAFDYLRDNLVDTIEKKIQGDLFFAIIDEVDNILIDEARTPLIISAQGDDPEQYYELMNDIMYGLEKDKHYKVNFKSKTAFLTSKGWNLLESFLLSKGVRNIFDENIHICHYIRNSLNAHKAMILNKDYVVLKDEIVIIDEFTGRLSKGRRYSNGLHQAIEAKEKVEIRQESKNQASISYTSFYNSYEHICGMTGTALEDVDEFNEIYNLDVVPIPPNKPIKRIDYDGIRLYRSKMESLLDSVKLIQEAVNNNQPVLACTSSVDESMALSKILEEKSIDFNLLNATNHEKEAYIIAQAGRPGRVTVSTNMAGRGTDIPLGGDVEMNLKEILSSKPDVDQDQMRTLIENRCMEEKKIVLDAGGLFVIIIGAPDSVKTEIQIKGRAGRQGDIGKSIKMYSLEDEIVLPLYQDKINTIMLDYYFPQNKKFTVSEKGNEIISSLQNEYKFYYRSVRKNTFKYNEEFSKQREFYYNYRDYILTRNQEELHYLPIVFLDFLFKQKPEKASELFKDINIDKDNSLDDICRKHSSNIEIEEHLDKYNVLLKNTMKFDGSQVRSTILGSFDEHWFDHLVESSNLHQTNILNHYKNSDPLQEFNDLAAKLMNSFLEKSVTSIIEQILQTVSSKEFDFSFSENQEEMEDLFEKLLRSVDNEHQEYNEDDDFESNNIIDNNDNFEQSTDDQSTNDEENITE